MIDMSQKSAPLFGNGGNDDDDDDDDDDDERDFELTKIRNRHTLRCSHGDQIGCLPMAFQISNPRGTLLSKSISWTQGGEI